MRERRARRAVCDERVQRGKARLDRLRVEHLDAADERHILDAALPESKTGPDDDDDWE
mgnify:CR=1 FL=1